MKQVFILLLLLHYYFLPAQSVFPTFKDKPAWCIEKSVFGGPYQSSVWTLGADTTICGKIWNPFLECPTTASSCMVRGYIRQEGQRVYRKRLDCSEELLYDFSLQEGDTIRNRTTFLPGIVSDIDTIKYNGIPRRTFTIYYILDRGPLPPIGFRRVWIEGIGDTSNPLYPFDCIEGSCEYQSRIACFSSNGSVLYGDCTEACGIDTAKVFPTYEQGAIWCMQDRAFLTLYPPYTIEVAPDTIICGQKYSPLLAKNYPNGLSGQIRPDFVYGYIRQEGKRVYQLLRDCQERLLYDFSLNAGDTLKFSMDGLAVNAVIYEINYLNFIGVSRKIFTVLYTTMYGQEVLYWVEGLGGLFHPLMDLECVLNPACDGGSGIVCLSDKTSVLLGDCAEGCNIISDTEEAPPLGGTLKLVPNPIPKGEALQVHFQFQHPVSGNLAIVNVLGQVLYRQAFESGATTGNFTLPWSPEVPGMYWLVLQNKNGNKSVLPFVIQ